MESINKIEMKENNMEMSNDDYCSLERLIEDIKIMPTYVQGFKIICIKGRMIRIINSILNVNSQWIFNIGRDDMVDFFLLVARERTFFKPQRPPIYMWLIDRNEIIRGKKSYDRDGLVIQNMHKELLYFLKNRIYFNI